MTATARTPRVSSEIKKEPNILQTQQMRKGYRRVSFGLAWKEAYVILNLSKLPNKWPF